MELFHCVPYTRYVQYPTVTESPIRCVTAEDAVSLAAVLEELVDDDVEDGVPPTEKMSQTATTTQTRTIHGRLLFLLRRTGGGGGGAAIWTEAVRCAPHLAQKIADSPSGVPQFEQNIGFPLTIKVGVCKCIVDHASVVERCL